MLPLMNLDDRMFEQWIAEARKSIQKRYPEWTDENEHDPGITLLELFAWLGEMQQYYLSRISPASEIKFLKLLGIALKEPECARTLIRLDKVDISRNVPKGMKVLADDVPFETNRSAMLLHAQLEKIIVRTDMELNDYSSSNVIDNVAYYAFGAAARKGSQLFLGFNKPVPPGEYFDLHVELFGKYPVEPGPYEPTDPFLPSAQLAWQYYGECAKEGGVGWFDMDALIDETQHLSFSGRLRLRTAGQMKELTLHPANDRPRYWISCVLEREGYELPPKIDSISVNVLPVTNTDTQSLVRTFDSSGEEWQRYELDDRLSYDGVIEVQVWDEAAGCWCDWRQTDKLEHEDEGEPVFTVEKDAVVYVTTVRFGDGRQGRRPPQGKQNVRIVILEPGFEGARLLGPGNGLPHQRFTLPWSRIMKRNFRLQSSFIRPDNGEIGWLDWERVDDFDRSSPADRHYVLDAKQSELLFGDHERGLALPKSGLPNIRIIGLQLGGGISGNVKQGKITSMAPTKEWWSKLAVSNPLDAGGGADAETLAEAKLRAMLSIREAKRAVTDEDYERLARQTPGLRVARVKTLALFRPGLSDYPRETAPAQTTVIVVPYSEQRIPKPSPQFLLNVRRHLEPFRLIATELHVAPPEYVKITVHAVVIVEPYFKKDSPKIMEALHGLLQPIGPDGGGWEFGRPVYKGDIYSVINQLSGVTYIQDLWLEAHGNGTTKDKNGDILLPPHGLVYSGEHSIECISRTEL